MSNKCSFCSDLDHRTLIEKMIPFDLGLYKSELVLALSYDDTEGNRIVSSLWAEAGEEAIDKVSFSISYCPICGRRL